MKDELDIVEAIELLEKEGYDIIKEDFGMGVGGPMGLDQGIPHGGDCKGCCPQRMGLYQRSPFSVNPLYHGVPNAHHPDYWLNQIPKKKKKRKKLRRRKRVNENRITDWLNRNEQVFKPVERICQLAISLLKQKFGNDPDIIEKFEEGYDDGSDYATMVTKPSKNADHTLLSDDPIHIFARNVGRICTNHQFSTNKDFAQIVKEIKMEFNRDINNA